MHPAPPPAWLTAVRVCIVLAAVAGPVLYGATREEEARNFKVVREGVLYRSGQVTVPALKRLVHDHGIRTVVSLREGLTEEEIAEEAWCEKEGIVFVRINPRQWLDPQTGLPRPRHEGVEQFLKVMDDPSNHPVLLHCFAGTHRTGAYCAVYRMEYQDWSNAAATEELKAQGYPHLEREQDIATFLRLYRPRSWSPTARP